MVEYLTYNRDDERNFKKWEKKFNVLNEKIQCLKISRDLRNEINSVIGFLLTEERNAQSLQELSEKILRIEEQINALS